MLLIKQRNNKGPSTVPEEHQRSQVINYWNIVDSIQDHMLSSIGEKLLCHMLSRRMKKETRNVATLSLIYVAIISLICVFCL